MLLQAPEFFAHSLLADIAKTHGPLKEVQNVVTGQNTHKCLQSLLEVL